MHKFIYSSEDSFIWNYSNYLDKNFGLDEILEIESSRKSVRSFISSSLTYVDKTLININVINFNGTVTGSIVGTGSISASLSGCCDMSYTEEGC